MKRLLWFGSRRCAIVCSAVLVVSALAAGCNSLAGRFMARALTDGGKPIQPAPGMIRHPVLDDPDVAVLWVGHATVLLQIHDKVFITDPILTRTAGMVLGRNVEPGLDPSCLKAIDFTLISHGHFDHLSYGSLDLLPQNGVLLLPDGMLAYLPEFAYREVRELKPWEVLEEDGVGITAVPVRHFSGRYGFDAAWMGGRGFTGYVIQYRGRTVLFGGDTAYDPEIFKDIGRRFSIDVALLPIAPIEPRSFMRRYHLDPAEAIQALSDLGARFLVPIHHRTFTQGLDPDPNDPARRLAELSEKQGIRDRVMILDTGEQRVLAFP